MEWNLSEQVHTHAFFFYSPSQFPFPGQIREWTDPVASPFPMPRPSPFLHLACRLFPAFRYTLSSKIGVGLRGWRCSSGGGSDKAGGCVTTGRESHLITSAILRSGPSPVAYLRYGWVPNYPPGWFLLSQHTPIPFKPLNKHHHHLLRQDLLVHPLPQSRLPLWSSTLHLP